MSDHGKFEIASQYGTKVTVAVQEHGWPKPDVLLKIGDFAAQLSSEQAFALADAIRAAGKRSAAIGRENRRRR